MNHGELPISEHDLAPPPDDPELAQVLAPLSRDECECEALCTCNEEEK